MSKYTTSGVVCVTNIDEEATDEFYQVHTPEQPYCDDDQCVCHFNTAWHAAIKHREPTADEIEEVIAFHELTLGGGY